jgi:hypothetical protein
MASSTSVAHPLRGTPQKPAVIFRKFDELPKLPEKRFRHVSGSLVGMV